MNFEQARTNMVLNQLRANRIKNSSLIEKIELFPRENLYPKTYKHLAYSDKIIFLDDGRFILPPLTDEASSSYIYKYVQSEPFVF